MKYLNTTHHGIVDPECMEIKRIMQYNALITRIHNKIRYTTIEEKTAVMDALSRIKKYMVDHKKTLQYIIFGNFLAAFSQSKYYEL